MPQFAKYFDKTWQIQRSSDICADSFEERVILIADLR